MLTVLCLMITFISSITYHSCICFAAARIAASLDEEVVVIDEDEEIPLVNEAGEDLFAEPAEVPHADVGQEIPQTDVGEAPPPRHEEYVPEYISTPLVS